MSDTVQFTSPPTLLATPEEWRDVPGYEGRYRVSDQGHVVSLRTGRSLFVGIRDGYSEVRLYKNETTWHTGVHSLVALAFIGPRPDGAHVDHINANVSDNRPSNLRYLSLSENVSIAQRRNGTYVGNSNPSAKLSDDQRREILSLWESGLYTRAEIARRFNVSRSHVSRMVRGECCAYLRHDTLKEHCHAR